MHIKNAAIETAKLIDQCNALSDDNPETGKAHLHEMAQKIVNGEVLGEKAHRWLGWLQACICIGGGATLEQLKLINYES